MTARKPHKTASRKASKPTLEQRVDAIESRERLRDKLHDEPVGNVDDVIYTYPDTTPLRFEWMKQPPQAPARRRKWWQFWGRT